MKLLLFLVLTQGPFESFVLNDLPAPTFAYWLDETAGNTVVDATSNGNDATNDGGALEAASLIVESSGTAYTFLDADTRIDGIADTFPGCNFTVALWARVDQQGVDCGGDQECAGLFRKSGAFGTTGNIVYDAGSDLYRVDFQSGINFASHESAAFDPSVPHFYVFVFDDTNDKLFIYLDGGQVAVADQDAACVNNTSPWIIGNHGGTPDTPLSGTLDAFVLWDSVALSGAQILTMYKRATLGEEFIRGDVNFDGDVTSADLSALNAHLSGGGLTCLEAADVNGDDAVNSADQSYLFNYLFSAGPAPVGPFPTCGQDPNKVDTLTCTDSPFCN